MGPIFDMLFPWPRALFSPGRSLRVGSGPLNYFIIRCSRELGSVPDVGGQVLFFQGDFKEILDWRKLFFATLPSTFDNGLLKFPQERCCRKLFLAWDMWIWGWNELLDPITTVRYVIGWPFSKYADSQFWSRQMLLPPSHCQQISTCGSATGEQPLNAMLRS